MALGSETLAMRANFNKTGHRKWKDKIVNIESAKAMIESIRLKANDSYGHRKIRDIEGYIDYVESKGSGTCTVFCEQCHTSLYEAPADTLTFKMYEGAKCIRNCKSNDM